MDFFSLIFESQYKVEIWDVNNLDPRRDKLHNYEYHWIDKHFQYFRNMIVFKHVLIR